MQFLASSCAFYALMGVGSQVAASYLGVHPDILDAMRDVNIDQGSLWSLPLLASLAFAITQADRFEFLGEVETSSRLACCRRSRRSGYRG